MEYLTLSTECGTIRVRISTGWIFFESNPAGAEIFLIAKGGGQPVDILLQTPKTIELSVGDYDYLLKLPGYKEYTGSTTVNSGDTTYISVDLVPIPSSSAAIMAVSGLSILGLLLASSTKSAIPLTTGKLGGEMVTLKL